MRTVFGIALLCFLHTSPLFATCPAGTSHIVWNLLLNDNVTPAQGTINIYGPVGASAAATSQTLTIGTAGLVDICLIGGSAVSYRARYQYTAVVSGKTVPTQSWEERWWVPLLADTSKSLTIPALWGGVTAQQGLLNQQQVNPSGLSPGQGWYWDGSSWAPFNLNGGGTWGDWGGTWGGQ